jgi:hypothetical protein
MRCGMVTARRSNKSRRRSSRKVERSHSGPKIELPIRPGRSFLVVAVVAHIPMESVARSRSG